MCSDRPSCGEILASPPAKAKLVKRMARGVVLAAESSWRNADIAAVGRTEAGPAVLRQWIGTWTQALVPYQTAKLWTASTIAPLDCGPKKPEHGQQLPQPCPRKLRSVALAEVLMKLTESCVIEHHTDRLLKSVEPTNLGAWHAGCGGADSAHCTGLGERHGGAPKEVRMLKSCCHLTWKTLTAELFDLRAWKRPELHVHS